MIPRIIHQIYMQGWDRLPADVKLNISALRARNPGWEYRFYDEVTGRQFLMDHLPNYLVTYDSIDPAYFAARSDFLRYCICYVIGGFYIDVKSVAKKKLDEVLLPEDEIVLSQWTVLNGKPSSHPELRHISGCEYVNFFIASSRANPLLKAVIEEVAQKVANYRFWDGVGRKGVLRITGPIAYSLTIEANRADHPHRIANMENDLHLEFSFYGDHFSHRTRLGQHYSELHRPIVQSGSIQRALAFVIFGPLASRFRRLKTVFSRIPEKLRRYAKKLL